MSIYQEAIKILILYAKNNRSSKCMPTRKKLIEPQEEIDKSKFIVGNSNTPQYLVAKVEQKYQ